MDTRFFKSKEFVIAALVAALLVVSGVVASSQVNLSTGVFATDGCSVPVPAGTELAPTRDDSGVRDRGDRAQRVVTYTLDDVPDGLATVLLCTQVGDVDVTPSPDDRAHLVFTITNKGPDGRQAVTDQPVEVRFLDTGNGLTIASWQPELTRARGFFDSQSTQVAVELELPRQHTYDLNIETDVGDIVLASMAVRDITLETDVGDIEAEGVELARDVTARTDVGDIELSLASVGTGRWDLRTDVGDIDLHVPGSQDIGYEVEAETDVGRIHLDIGETEHHVEDSRGPSHEANARTRGYAEKPNRVTIDAKTDVGSISITVR